MGTPTGLSRRRLLTTAAVTGAGVALGGCTQSSPTRTGHPAGTATSSPSGPVNPTAGNDADVGLVEAAIADERVLLAYCRDCVASHPDIAATLKQIEQQQRRHVAALRATLGRHPHNRVGSVPNVRGDRAAVLGTVRRLVAQARRRRRRDALAAQSGLLARLMASISASHAVAAGLDGLHA